MKQNGTKRRKTVELEVEDRPIGSLTADELFAAALPRVPVPIEYEKLEQFYRREHGISLLLDSVTYDYHLPRYTRNMLRRHL